MALQVMPPKGLSEQPDGAATHVALPFALDRGQAVILIDAGQARALAERLASVVLAMAAVPEHAPAAEPPESISQEGLQNVS